MEKHVKFYIVFILILTSGFIMGFEKNDTEDYEIYVNAITRSFSRQIIKEFNVICIGTGGRMPHDVEIIGVDFLSYEAGTIEKAREFIVKATEKFLRMINENTDIRPFLREYPFKANRAEISIAYRRRSDNAGRKDGSLIHTFQGRNRIFYYVENTDGKRVKVKEEPYDDALKIVMGNGEKKVD